MTLIFYVSCANCQNVISEADKDLEEPAVCERSGLNIKCVGSYGSMLKWFSDSEAYSDAIKDDVCNWIKKALGQGRKHFYFIGNLSVLISELHKLPCIWLVFFVFL